MSKVIFQPMSLEMNIGLIKWQYRDFNDLVVKMFPELKDLDENHKDEIISKVVTKYYIENIEKINNKINEFKNIWEKYNDLFFKTLSDYLNVSFIDNITITALVGLVPIFPRYLDDYSYALSPYLDDSSFLRISAHEICHFYWFKKWLLLFPDTKRKELDMPYLPWKYSEMVVDPILNSKVIQNVFNNQFYAKAYLRFYEVDKGKLMDELKNIYDKNISIENKINEGYELVKMYQDRL